MDLSFSQEHEELRRTVRRFLQRESSEPVVRGLMETERGYDELVWLRTAEELALPGLIVPESYGGAGLGPIELTVVMEEMGRVLFCGPFLSTAVLATNVLLHAAEENFGAPILQRIASGSTTATVAVAEDSGDWEPATVAVAASRDGSGYRLEGVKSFVIDGHTAEVLLVVARAEDGVALFRVDGSSSHLRRAVLPTLDLTRKLARIEFSATPAIRISVGDASAALERALALTVAFLAAEQVGGAQRCLEMATDYAKNRLQFGRLIGSYQAIKHKCADTLVEVELARSAAYNAAFSALQEDDEGEIFVAARMAKSFCSEAYFHAAAENIQIHGGLGFTWEHPAHLYFKRARASSELFGSPLRHRRRLADRVGL